MKKIALLVVIMILFAFCLLACGGGGATAADGPVEMDGGVYEGELNGNGERNGYGVWVFDNFRYEGNWENNLPNGQGTLSRTATESGTGGPVTLVDEAMWVNGYADGNVIHTSVYEDGHTNTWEFPVTNGRVLTDMKIESPDTPTLFLNTADCIGVPPFAAEVKTVPDVDAPTS